MKNWSKITLVAFMAILISITISLLYSIKSRRDIANKKQTSEYNEIEYTNNLDVISTNYSGLKVSPNATIVFEQNYNKCNHKEIKEERVKESIVNLNELEVQEVYQDWTIKQFSTDKIMLYKEIEGYCGKHYILKETDGYIGIFKLLENGEEELVEITNISVQYLPETDSLNLKNGLKIYTKESVNKILEDFE